MFDMDDLLSWMLETMPESLEHQRARQSEGRLMDKLLEAVGEELVGKLLDAQAERMMVEYRQFFLWGLRLGVELDGV